MNQQYLGIFFAVSGSLLSSIAWVYEGEAVRHLGPWVTACSLNLLGAAFLLAYLAISGQLPRLADLKNQRRDLLSVSLVRQVVLTSLFTTALTGTEGIKVMFFTKLEPYFVLLLGWFIYKRAASLRQLLLLALHLAGAVVLSTNGEFHFGTSQASDLLVLLAVFLSAATYPHAARLAAKLGAIQTNACAMLLAGIVLLPMALAVPAAPNEGSALLGWKYILVTVLAFHVFGLSAWYAALPRLRDWLVSALRAVGPILGAPVAWFLFGQTFSLLQAGGALVVLVTSAIMAAESRRTAQ